MGSRSPIAFGEWYHCYNRGVDKRIVFEEPRDYERFLIQMYIGNGIKNIRASLISDLNLLSVLADISIDRGEPLIEIGAYALMPNHVHFLLRETSEGGIAAFMQKLFTGYTMYFNNSRERTGSLFAGTFKSKHIDDDKYLKHAVSYVHLNSVELFEPRWKEGVGDIDSITSSLLAYPYSSLQDFVGEERLEKKIIGTSLFAYYDKLPSLAEMLNEAQSYYQN